MQFCPKCGVALLPTSQGRAVVLSCQKCGYSTRRGVNVVQPIAHASGGVVVVRKQDAKLQSLPKVKAFCERCGNSEAYWSEQTGGADEHAVQIFRCTSCGATWRESA